MDEKQSLEIIYDMIERARSNIQYDSYFYLLWGWLAFGASLMHYTLLHITPSAYAALPWLGVVLIGMIGTFIEARKRYRNQRVRTHFNEIIMYVWIAISTALFLLIGISFSSGISFTDTQPIIIILYGIGTFISGKILQFIPMMIGAILCWVIAIPAFFIAPREQLLMIALALLVSYLIPGYLLKRKN